MIIPSISAAAAYKATSGSPLPPSSVAGNAANIADRVTISPAARAAFLASATNSSATSPTDARLAEIKSKDALSRTAEDTDYLFAHDARLATIRDKNPDSLTAEELDYEQKAGGFVNTMANLSPAEKGLYDKMVASGDKAAAAGMSQIAFIRTMGHMAGGANGTTYDPISTEITAANIGKYFSHSIVDPSGKAQAQFQALIKYLQSNPANS